MNRLKRFLLNTIILTFNFTFYEFGKYVFSVYVANKLGSEKEHEDF